MYKTIFHKGINPFATRNRELLLAQTVSASIPSEDADASVQSQDDVPELFLRHSKKSLVVIRYLWSLDPEQERSCVNVAQSTGLTTDHASSTLRDLSLKGVILKAPRAIAGINRPTFFYRIAPIHRLQHEQKTAQQKQGNGQNP